MARFYIGQPVVCVDDRIRPSVARVYPQITDWPKAGAQYRIRANMTLMTRVSRRKWTPLTFVLVHGISNPLITWGDGTRAEAGFHEDRFEPATNIGELEKVAQQTGLWMGGFDKEIHVDEPDLHPTEETVE